MTSPGKQGCRVFVLASPTEAHVTASTGRKRAKRAPFKLTGWAPSPLPRNFTATQVNVGLTVWGGNAQRPRAPGIRAELCLGRCRHRTSRRAWRGALALRWALSVFLCEGGAVAPCSCPGYKVWEPRPAPRSVRACAAGVEGRPAGVTWHAKQGLLRAPSRSGAECAREGCARQQRYSLKNQGRCGIGRRGRVWQAPWQRQGRVQDT